MDLNVTNNFNIINEYELVEIEGGVAPIILFFAGVGTGISATATAIHTLNKVANLKW